MRQAQWLTCDTTGYNRTDGGIWLHQVRRLANGTYQRRIVNNFSCSRRKNFPGSPRFISCAEGESEFYKAKRLRPTKR